MKEKRNLGKRKGKEEGRKEHKDKREKERSTDRFSSQKEFEWEFIKTVLPQLAISCLNSPFICNLERYSIINCCQQQQKCTSVLQHNNPFCLTEMNAIRVTVFLFVEVVPLKLTELQV